MLIVNQIENTHFSKTEREIVAESKEIAEQNGFKNLETMQELKAGDKVYWLSTGAYTSTYASVAFNGFPPIKTYFM